MMRDSQSRCQQHLSDAMASLAINRRQPNLPASTSLSVGLLQLQAHCSTAYALQPQEPLCLRPNKSLVKEGGSDPLDYIYIYKNEGDIARAIPRHWHYIGFGLSDIHNYQLLYFLDAITRLRNPIYASSTPPMQQLYPLPGSSAEKLSGFGFELTFRVRCDSQQSWTQDPPKWPGQVMQALARYVFQSKNVFKVGDHAAWNCSLDGNDESRIEHMLMTLDPQLKEAETSLGRVVFIQLVGVCQEELQAAREWNVRGILDIMKERIETGGEYFVSDMRRGETIFELEPENLDRVNAGIREMGSDLTLVSAKHKFSASKPNWYKEAENLQASQIDGVNLENESPLPSASASITTSAVSCAERGNFLTMPRSESHLTISHDYQQSSGTRNPSRMSYESESALMVENAEFVDTRYYDSLYLLLNYESAKILPVVLNGRLAHKRHFTYQSFKGDLLTTFVPEGTAIESLVSCEQTFARKGVWLQIFVSNELRQLMLEEVKNICNEETAATLPKNYSWPEHKLFITVVQDVTD